MNSFIFEIHSPSLNSLNWFRVTFDTPCPTMQQETNRLPQIRSYTERELEIANQGRRTLLRKGLKTRKGEGEE